MNRADFGWFVRERELIRTKKEFGEPHPLTEDPRLRDFWFPNIRREDDRTTVWFRAAVRDRIQDPDKLLMAIVTFRIFNKIETGELIREMLVDHGYDRSILLATLGPRCNLFNPHLPFQMLQFSEIIRILDEIESDYDLHWAVLGGSLQQMYEALLRVRGIGSILAYEVVCDLRRTTFLNQATDILTWAAPTAQACKGAGLLLDRDMSDSRTQDRVDTIRLMQNLLVDTWEMSEAQRALSLFYVWARPARPMRRYRWK